MAGKDLSFFITADVSKVFSILGKVDYIVHAASQASPKFYGTDPVGTILPNVLGTYQLLELARKKKIQGMLFFSSGEVYGKVNTRIVGENDYGYLDSDPGTIVLRREQTAWGDIVRQLFSSVSRTGNDCAHIPHVRAGHENKRRSGIRRFYRGCGAGPGIPSSIATVRRSGRSVILRTPPKHFVTSIIKRRKRSGV